MLLLSSQSKILKAASGKDSAVLLFSRHPSRLLFLRAVSSSRRLHPYPQDALTSQGPREVSFGEHLHLTICRLLSRE